MRNETDLAEALRVYSSCIRAVLELDVPGQPEDQLKAPIAELLKAAGNVLGASVATKTESPVAGLGARPDMGVAVQGFLTGHVELKAPGRGARPERFRGAEKKQWEKFSTLPNLLYTDGTEWSLYRTGELQGQRFALPPDFFSQPDPILSDSAVSSFGRLLRDFLSWQPVIPASPRALALVLAPLCRLLRTDVLAALERKGSALSLLAGEWRTYLFPEADNNQFADAYAQTLTYALLLARFEGVTDLRTGAADALDHGHGLLAQVLRVLAQPEARKRSRSP